MTWPRQVGHVALKDLRQARWLVIAYGAAAFALTAAPASWPRSSWSAPEQFQLVLVVAFGMIVAASFIHADSPSRVDAFWATRPLSATAVVGAKIVVIAATVLVPAAIGMAIALRAFAFPSGDGVRLLLSYGGDYTVFLVLATAVAVVTPDLRTFVVVLAGGFLLAQVEVSLLSDLGSFTVPSIVKTATPLVLSAIVIVYQYRTRDTRRGRRLGIAAGATMTAVMTVTTAWVAPTVTVPPSRTALVVTEARLETGRLPNYLVLHVRGPESSTNRVILQSPRATLVWTTGPRVQLGSPQEASPRRDTLTTSLDFVPLNYPPLLVGDSLRWLNRYGCTSLQPCSQVVRTPHHPEGGVTFDVTPDQSAAIARGDVGVELDGVVTIAEPLSATTLALRNRGTAGIPGRRFAYVDSATRAPSWVRLRDATMDGSPVISHVVDFVLVNDERREALGMNSAISTTSTLTPLMAGVTIQQTTMDLLPQGWLGTPPGVGFPDASWMRGAHLAIIGWKTAHSVPATVSVAPAAIVRRE